MSDAPRKLEKVFGSWEEIHPAALGVHSQEKAFRAGGGEGMHPASFRRDSTSDGDSIGSTRSSALTAPRFTPFYDICHHHDNNLSASLDPLDILTGEWHPGAAPERLSYE
ncbi:unnamed protein product, partial [Ectocarpus sp. 12 AP-2014]